MSGKGGVLRTVTPFYTTDNGEYGYTPLEAGEIRLIRILHAPSLPGDSDDESDESDAGLGSITNDGHHCVYEDNEMHIQIVHAAVAECEQDYSAISYCWGDVSDQRAVVVHEGASGDEVQLLSITASLYTAIQRAWQVYLHGAPSTSPTSISRFFWADGICIRQAWDESDAEEDAVWTQEKAEQVKLMGSIYQNAISVMFDLGDETDDLDVAYRMIRTIFEAVNKAGREGRLDRRQRIEPPEFPKYGLPMPEDPQWRAWTRFIARPWFRRVWIVQEFTLARAGWFLFGSNGHSLPWNVLPELVTYMSVLGLDDSRRRMSSNASVEERLHAHRSIGALVTQQAWRDRIAAGRKLTLLEALKNTVRLECKDARDRAYSLLGMCADVDYKHPDLLVDYGRSTTAQSVLERFTRWIFQHDERAIEVLEECGGSQLLGPSWCPNWHLARETGSLRTMRMGKQVYAAGGDGDGAIRFDTGRNVVICRGLVVDQVLQLGPILSLGVDLKPAEEHSRMLAWESQTRHWLLNNMLPRANREVLSPLANMINKYRDKHRLEESYIRVLSGDNLDTGNTEADHKAAYETLAVGRQGLDLDLGVSITTLFPDSDSYARHEKKYSDFTRQMSRLAGGRRLCITYGGSIGLVPARVRVRDVVVVLLGAGVPFAVRQQNDSFVLLGQSYVDGIMSGEALSGNQREGFLPFEE